MMKSRMRKPRLMVLAAMLAASGFATVALADDAKPEKSATETALEKLVNGFYGTIDISIDDATKGMGGMVAYHYAGAAVNGVYAQLGAKGPGSVPVGSAAPGNVPYGRVGMQPDISTNKSGLGWRGSHSLPGTDTKFVIQIEANVGFTAAPGLKTSYTAQGNTVSGTIGSGTTFVGFAGKDWGAVKVGTTKGPYAKSTQMMDPFSGMVGSMNTIMANTGGDNRVEFDATLEHSIWYESPDMGGFSYDILFSPGQNRTPDNVVQSAGSSDCNGGNLPGSGNLPLNCDDGGFDNAFSLDLNYKTKQLVLTAAYELHKNVNRNSDGIGSGAPLYGVDTTLLDPAYLAGGSFYSSPLGTGAGGPGTGQFYANGGTAPFISDIADEAAYKVGAQYIADFGLTVSAIAERMTRKVPNSLAFQNERQRNGFWLALTQEISVDDNVSFGWAHAGKTPGDPGGQHNYNPNNTNDTADMFSLAYKRKIDKHLYWYANVAETVNHGNAHYDLGAGSHGVKTDCHDGTTTAFIDYSSAGNTTWGGCKPKAISLGVNYKF